jgi:glycerophosphoryl diester phosphodiesterase
MLTRLLSLSGPAVIAHRGGSKVRPENTMAAFDHAVALGVDALECDVHLSRDREVVVIHDATLQRTTDRTGPVGDFTALELERVDAGFHFRSGGEYPYRGRGFGVPRLADLLPRHPTLPFVVEVKGDQPAVARAALDEVARAGAEDRVIFGGFSQAVLDEIRRRAPQIPTSASRRELRSALRRARFRMPLRTSAFRLFQAPYYFHGRRVFGRSFVDVARRRELPLHAWIVDDEADMRKLVGWGVTGLISDRPDVAVRVREALRAQGLGPKA